jgi:hypothetical protein
MVSTRTARRAAVAVESPARRTWAPVHYLAIIGVCLLVWEASTLAGWIADGPSPVNATRTTFSASWYAARVFEGLAVLMACVMATSVVRGCLRARRLTLDGMFVICGALAYWTDPFLNFLQPIFSYSSNWVNLSDWTCHVPFWRNPNGCLMPEPVLFTGLVYAFGILLFARLVGAAMGAARRRWPGISRLRLVGIAIGLTLGIDFALEAPPILLHLWAYPGQPTALTIPFGGGTGYPLVEGVAFAIAIGGMAAIRFFRDDRGRSVVERGLDRLRSVHLRSLISVLALTGAMQGALIGLNAADAAFGLYSSPYPTIPAHVLNGLCGAATTYGPCPGSPGYRMPIRGS